MQESERGLTSGQPSTQRASKHLKNAAGLTLTTPPGLPDGTPPPQLIRITIDDDIDKARLQLAAKQRSLDVLSRVKEKDEKLENQRRDLRWECEQLDKELGRLGKSKASGVRGVRVIELPPLSMVSPLPTTQKQEQ